MKNNKLSYCILSLLLSTAAVFLFCSCNKNPMLAMASEVSDVIPKKTEHFVNSHGGNGNEVMANPECLKHEELQPCTESGLTTQLERQESQMQSPQKSYGLCVEGTLTKACENKTQEISEPTQKINNNLTIRNDDLTSQKESLQASLAAPKQSSSKVLGVEKKHFIGIGTTTLVGVGCWGRMSNRLWQAQGKILESSYFLGATVVGGLGLSSYLWQAARREIGAKDAEIERLQEQVGEKNEAIERLQGETAAAIERLQEQVGEKNEAISQLRGEVSEKEVTIRQLQEKVGGKDAEILLKEIDLRKLKRDVARLEKKFTNANQTGGKSSSSRTAPAGSR